MSRKVKVQGTKKKRAYVGMLFVFPGFLGVLVFYLVPFLDVLRRSFMRMTGSFCGLQNYKTVFQNEAFRLAAGNTLRFVFVCLPLLLLLSLMLAALLRSAGAYACASGVSIRRALLIPYAVPAASLVLFWRVLFDGQGFVNGILSRIGLAGCDWMNTKNAFYVLVGSYIWKNIGYVVVLFLAAMAAIPASVYEAAKTDGAGEVVSFFYITLPCLRSAIFTILIISLLNSFKVFREAYLVAGSYPHESIYLLQHVFNNWFLSLSVDKMAAGAVLLAIVVSLFVRVLEHMWEI